MKTKSSGSSSSSGFTRRRFLRGLGACVALPALESLAPVRLLAAATPLATTVTGAPLRTAFLYFPNGAIPSAWWPKGDAANFTFNRTLEPLESFRSKLQVLGGLDHLNAASGPDGHWQRARARGGLSVQDARVQRAAERGAEEG